MLLFPLRFKDFRFLQARGSELDSSGRKMVSKRCEAMSWAPAAFSLWASMLMRLDLNSHMLSELFFLAGFQIIAEVPGFVTAPWPTLMTHTHTC